MTRDQWYIQYRRERSLRPRPGYPTSGMIVAALKELYGCMMSAQDEIFCRLVERYKGKLPSVYDIKYLQAKERGKERASAFMKDIICRENPFLALVSKKNRDSE